MTCEEGRQTGAMNSFRSMADHRELVASTRARRCAPQPPTDIPLWLASARPDRDKDLSCESQSPLHLSPRESSAATPPGEGRKGRRSVIAHHRTSNAPLTADFPMIDLTDRQRPVLIMVLIICCKSVTVAIRVTDMNTVPSYFLKIDIPTTRCCGVPLLNGSVLKLYRSRLPCDHNR